MSPKPKNPTDVCGEEKSSEFARDFVEGVGTAGLNGTETLTVVPLPWLLRTWTVPPCAFTI